MEGVVLSALSLCLTAALAAAAAADAAALPPFTIAPGVEMPAISLGHPDDSGGKSKNEAASAEMWLSLGGTGIDTAARYHNQGQVAIAIGATVAKRLNRSAIFVTTKISPQECSQAAALNAVQEDLRELKLSTVDLVLHHFPCRHNAAGNLAVWKGLLQAKRMGLARAVGVSNYQVNDLEALLRSGVSKPAVNQCKMSISSHDDATIAFCQKRGITYESYSPLRDVDLSDKTITSIARAHNVTAAQVALRWVVQQGCPVATSPGINREYCAEDLNLARFTLSTEEMKTLSGIRSGGGVGSAVGALLLSPLLVTTWALVFGGLWLLYRSPLQPVAAQDDGTTAALLQASQSQQQHGATARKNCTVSTASLFTIAIAFWSTGCLVCAAVCANTTRVTPAKCVTDTCLWTWHLGRFVSLEIGLVLGGVQGYYIMWRSVARQEAIRIASLTTPQCHHFFPARRLLLLCVLCPTCVQIQLHTAQYVVSSLVFVALLSNVAVALLFGAARLAREKGERSG
jgi:2,5-diketo-D-gluconate reductase A